MTSRSGALIAPPSWGRATPVPPATARPRREPVLVSPRVRWGIRAGAGAGVVAGAAILAATAGLWAAFLLAVW